MNARTFGMALGTLALALFSAAAGEESLQEQSLKQTLRVLDQLTVTLAKVTDAETAQAARPELQKAAKEWVVVKTKAKELPPPDQAEKDRLVKAYKGKLETSMKKFFVEVGRVRGFAAGREVLKDIKAVVVP